VVIRTVWPAGLGPRLHARRRNSVAFRLRSPDELRLAHQARIGRLETKLGGDVLNLIAGQSRSQIAKVGVAGIGQSRGNIQASVRTALPAAARLPVANVSWVLILVMLRVGKRRERFHERAKGNGAVSAGPARSEQSPGLRIEEQEGNVAASKFAFQYPLGGLREQGSRGRRAQMSKPYLFSYLRLAFERKADAPSYCKETQREGSDEV
jgi:hypothetical protein